MQILGSKLRATSWMDIYLSTYKDQPQLPNVYLKSLVLTDNFLYLCLQHQKNIHVHVLGAGNHIVCISNSHWAQYLDSVNCIDMLSKGQSNKAILEWLQKRTKRKFSSSVSYAHMFKSWFYHKGCGLIFMDKECEDIHIQLAFHKESPCHLYDRYHH